eukprot:TRINITY_DN90328_c0_g1_i1.p1 TRINITY_DN90328_c0_g1~~TRINITY_DN90328_c0_g1_i1.p1  ORF type:complete len:843 (+),score=225.14 TRINITY_DN90328_c0_g1_i1:93-2531(+)
MGAKCTANCGAPPERERDDYNNSCCECVAVELHPKDGSKNFDDLSRLSFTGDKPIDTDFEKKRQFLAQVTLFHNLPVELLLLLVQALSSVEFSSDDFVIKQGEEGDEFFLIQEGCASVYVSSDGKGLGSKVATLKEGDYFGEQALLYNDMRAATVRAETPLLALKLSRKNFEQLGLSQLNFVKRRAVVAGQSRSMLKHTPPEKSAEERELMKSAILKNPALGDIMCNDEEKLEKMVDLMWKEVVAPGEEVIQEGELDADYFYIVQEGSFRVTVSSMQGEERSAEKMIETAIKMTKGSSFGELALLYLAPRAATVTAEVESTVWVIDRGQFKDIVREASQKQRRFYIEALDKVDLLDPLLPEEKQAMASAMTEVVFQLGEEIVRQGEVGDYMYILCEGQAKVVVDGELKSTIQATTERAEIFGELALLHDKPRFATVEVESEIIRCLRLDRKTFNTILAPLQGLRDRGSQKVSAVKDEEAQAAWQPLELRCNVKKEELTKLGLLGCGGFGSVEMVQHKFTKEVYALKSLSKGYVTTAGCQQQVMTEKRIQWECDSPFIIKLYQTYNSKDHLHFLLELALGGELFATYHQKGLFGKEPLAKYYAAGTTFALEHLHTRRFIYRDLKPENLLLSDKGFVKLTDLGLAKFSVGLTYTTCGTPDYFAPETIAGSGHYFAVDWWALGVLIFELMTGKPPFEASTPTKTYQKILKGISAVPCPAHIAGPLREILKDLLRKDPARRLPMRAGGTANVKRHKWYEGFNWKGMQNQTLQPSYVPVVNSPTDRRNFRAKKEDMPPQIPYVDDKSGWDRDFATSG